LGRCHVTSFHGTVLASGVNHDNSTGSALYVSGYAFNGLQFRDAAQMLNLPDVGSDSGKP